MGAVGQVDLLERIRLALPPTVESHLIEDGAASGDVLVTLADRTLRFRRIGRTLADAQEALRKQPRPDVLVVSALSPAVRSLLSRERIGWVDWRGQVNISTDSVVVFREPGKKSPPISPRWTTSDLRVAETLLAGVRGTVSTVSAATQLSVASAATALKHLQVLGHLSSVAARGRSSHREVANEAQLLSAYVEALSMTPPSASLRIGVLWRDALEDLRNLSRTWRTTGVLWALTGPLASSQLAPVLTTTSPWEMYVEVPAPLDLEQVAEVLHLSPDPGGRLLLREWPRSMSPALLTTVDGLPIVPWPRVYADLQTTGIRGEEAAEHLREVFIQGG